MKNRPLRIIMAAACPFPTSQGSQILIRSVSEALEKSGHEVRIVSYHHSEPHIACDLPVHRIINIPTYRKLRAGPAFQKPVLDLMLAAKLYRVVMRYGADIIHAQNYEALVAGLLVRGLCNVPVLFHSHAVLTEELHRYFTSRWIRTISRATAQTIDNLLPAAADGCIASSVEDAAFYVSKGARSERVSVVPPPFFEEEFEADHEAGHDAGATDRRPPTVVYAGNLDPYQDLEVLFHAFKKVSALISDARLIILSRSDFRQYRNLAGKLGIAERCRFVEENGFKTTLVQLARSSVAVCTRTSSSGFPIKLLNYMGAGCPIVASEGSAKDIRHLHDGYIVRNGSAEELGRAIVTLIRNRGLADKLGSNARRTASDRYSWTRIARDIEDIYERIL
ncbi:glycosyltransferase family 4 protein [Thermodesulfobacteriota bacterium]